MIRYRRLQALVIVSMSALITACATYAPLFDRALQQATVAVRLDERPVQVTGLQLTSLTQYPTGALDAASMRELVPRWLTPFLGAAVPSTSVAVGSTGTRSRASTRGTLFWRAGMCDHVVFRAGRCPARRDEIAISTDDARNFGWRVGSRVRVVERVDDPVLAKTGATHAATLTVVATYAQQVSDYWYGRNVTGRSGFRDPDSGQPQTDDWLTPSATLDGPADSWWTAPVRAVDMPLRRDLVGLDEILRLGPVVDRFLRSPEPPSTADEVAPVVIAYSGIPDVADEVAHGRGQARVIVPLLMVQLGLLGVVVLCLVLVAATEQRRPEVAVARLRGRGVAGASRLLLTELGSLVLVGVPLGALAALGASYLTRHVWLPVTPPLEVGESFLVAAVGACAVLLLVTGAAAQRVAREPVSALLRRVPERRAGWRVGTLDAMVAAASATAVVAFATGDLRGPIALAAPVLIALLVALVLAHLLVPVAAAAGRALLSRGRASVGVSLLQVARRPATRRVVVIVVVASALLVFSADVLVVGDRNRAYASEQENGAPLVATAATTDLPAVLAALHAVDPRGRRVTPVTTVQPVGASGATTRGVIPEQFARIALFPGASPPATMWARIQSPSTGPVRLRGDTVSFRLSSALRSPGPSGSATVPPVMLSARLLGPDGRNALVDLAELSPTGGRARVVRAHVPCAQGCLLTGLGLDTDALRQVGGRFVVSRLRTPTSNGDLLGPASHWEAVAAGPTGSMTPETAGAGSLAVSFLDRGQAPLVMGHASVPTRLPALVAGALPPGSTGSRFTGADLDGVDRPMVRVGELPRVPAAPRNTNVVNLEVLMRDGALPQLLTRVQVWFADDDPGLLARVRASLERRGVVLSGASSIADVRRTYDRSAAAWSLQLAAAVGVAGLLLAAIALIVVAATTWRPRSRDFAALRMTGMSRSDVLVIAVVEQLPVLALAVVAGSACGVAGAHLALPTVPLFASAPGVSTLDLGTAWPAVLLAAALALGVLSGIGWAAASWLARRSSLQRVRESL